MITSCLSQSSLHSADFCLQFPDFDCLFFNFVLLGLLLRTFYADLLVTLPGDLDSPTAFAVGSLCPCGRGHQQYNPLSVGLSILVIESYQGLSAGRRSLTCSSLSLRLSPEELDEVS